MQTWTHEDEGWQLDDYAAAQLGDTSLLHTGSCLASVRNRRGWSAAMYASAAGHRSMLLILLQGEERQEAREQAMLTAVHFLDLDLIKFLVQQGLASQRDLNSGLVHAASLNVTEVAQVLLEMGANPTTMCEAAGKSALEMAIEMRHVEMTSLFNNSMPLDDHQAPQFLASMTWKHQSSSADPDTSLLESFCQLLAHNIEHYCPRDTMSSLLQTLELSDLWPLFQHEEVDFGVLMAMSDRDLFTIGVRSGNARQRILKARSNILSYFEYLFGTKIACKLFQARN